MFRKLVNRILFVESILSQKRLSYSKSSAKASTLTNRRSTANNGKLFNSIILFPSENWLEIILDTGFSSFSKSHFTHEIFWRCEAFQALVGLWGEIEKIRKSMSFTLNLGEPCYTCRIKANAGLVYNQSLLS